jgi:ketosteroid isomerase-like protein
VRTFERAAARLTQGRDARLEVHHVEVDGDVGVVAGVEHSVFSAEGGPPVSQSLRVTLVYRREDGAWRLVHRHAGGEP